MPAHSPFPNVHLIRHHANSGNRGQQTDKRTIFSGEERKYRFKRYHAYNSNEGGKIYTCTIKQEH